MGLRLIAAASVALAASAVSNLYVSPAGSNNNNGLSPGAAFASLQRALAAVDSMRPLKDDVVVNLASGTYFVGAAVLNLTVGGDADHALSFVGPTAPGAAPAVISGGVALSGWSVLDSTKGTYQVVVPPGALPEGVVPRSLWATDPSAPQQRREMAHTAVNTWAQLDENGTMVTGPTRTWDATPAQMANAYVQVWQSWTSSQDVVASWAPDSNTLTIEGSWGGQWLSASGNRYAIWNINDPSALQPGAFLYEPTTRTITYAALPGEDPTNPAAPPFVAEGLPVVLALTGTPAAPVVNTHFIGVSFAHSAAVLEACLSQGCNAQSGAALQYAAVTVDYASQVTFTGVEVAHTGGYGLWIRQGCADVSVAYGLFHDMGAGGIRIGNNAGGVGAPGSETVRVNVTDTVVQDTGYVVQAGVGVFVQQTANTTITHNAITRTLYTAISTGWTWGYAATSNANIEVSYNDVSDVFQGVLSDGGCWYNLGRSPGTVGHHNLCQRVNSFGYGGWGLYNDEGSSNVTTEFNVVFNTKSAGFHQHYGTDNVIQNNVFAEPAWFPCDGAQGCDNDAVRSSQHGNDHTQGMNSSFTFQRNIVFLSSNLSQPFSTTAGGPSAPWAGMSNMTLDFNLYHSTALPDANLTWPPTQVPHTWAEWQAMGKDAHSVLADPLFADAAGGNFTVLPGSPALALGFQNFDLSTVGPRPDAAATLAEADAVPASVRTAAAAAAEALRARWTAMEKARLAGPAPAPRLGARGSY